MTRADYVYRSVWAGEMDRERAERIADRRNERRREAAPLLALIGDVPQTTADAIIASHGQWAAEFEAGTREEYDRAMEYRRRCGELLDDAAIGRMDAHCLRVYPHSPLYWVDYWGAAWLRLARERHVGEGTP